MSILRRWTAVLLASFMLLSQMPAGLAADGRINIQDIAFRFGNSYGDLGYYDWDFYIDDAGYKGYKNPLTLDTFQTVFGENFAASAC